MFGADPDHLVEIAFAPALGVAKGHNHPEMGETIGHPYGIIGRAAFEMMKLSAA